MSKTKEELVFTVVIFRKNGDHISVMESEDYDKCFEKWVSLHEQWRDSAVETKPFVLTDPVVTAFEPGLISEVSLYPINNTVNTSKNDNPYYRKMNQQGFSETFGRYSGGTDLLDQGRF